MNKEQKREMIDGLLSQIRPTVEAMKPVLAGKEPVVQSASLAMCLAMWVKGHQVLGNPEATTELQDQVLAGHMELLIDLLESGAVEPITGNN